MFIVRAPSPTVILVVILTLSTSELVEAREHGALGVTVRERASGVIDHVRGAIDRVLHPAHTPSAEEGR